MVIVAWVYITFAIGDIPQTTSTVFTFISTPVSWNDAATVCEANGGKLANVESEVKEASMVSAVKHLVSRNLLGSSHLWIGLHQDGNTSDYVWSDCSNITGWQSWNETLDKDTTDHSCVSLDADVRWHPSNCSKRLPALCESYRPCGCEMGEEPSRCVDFSKTQSTLVTTTSLGKCQTKCMYHVTGDEECWAVTFYQQNGSCYLHERMSYASTCMPELLFYTKNCFTLTFPGAEFVNPVSVPDASSLPKNKCSRDASFDVTSAPCLYGYDTSTAPGLSVTVKTTHVLTSTATPSPEHCVCYKEQNTTLEERLEWLKAETRVDKRTTSQHKRRKSSATDYRLSARGIGAAGLVILIIVIGGIVLLDFGRLRLDFSRGSKNVAFCVSKTKRYIESRQKESVPQ
ncbi:Snaclec 3 [Mizuhopecten yessoensis]|uniref:Snaclec 3 n=1 Tax=Mizuhopecten yessoensis TaxID=6573 RepID=A0A210Q475_MIZYE|nr:Snaclec 3 [Mizuhopecten yessoensis]